MNATVAETLVHQRRQNGDAVRRAVAAAVAVVSGTILGLSAWLEPSSDGLGTHTQLYPFECSWVAIANLPCPTCGMTTAFAHAANGNLLTSFLTQPLGSLLAIATAMTFLTFVYVFLTGSRIAGIFKRLWSTRIAWTLSILVVVSWLYKIASYKELLG